MNHSRWIAALGLPVAVLAVAAAVLLSMSLGTDKTAEANQPNAGLEFTLHVGGCDTAGDTKNACTVGLGNTFTATVSIDSVAGIGNGSYDAWATTLNYTGVDSKDNQSANPQHPDCAFEATAQDGTSFVNAGCTIGISAPSSTYTGNAFQAGFNCTADGTISILHSPSETLVTDSIGKTNTEAGPDLLNIDCQPVPATFTPTPTSTPPPVPRVFKAPQLQNVFLQRQGTKIPPERCNDSTDVGMLTEQINVPVTSLNQKGQLQSLAAFEFEVRFNWTKCA